MNFRALLSLAVIASVAISGCAGNETEPFTPTSTPIEEPAGNETLNETVLESLFESFEFSVDGVNVTFFGNGTDANATWALDADDNGTVAEGVGLPFAINHTFEPGNHTVNLTVVSNGVETFNNATFVIEALVEEVVIPEPIVFTGAAIVPDPYYVGSGNECLGGIFVADSTGARHEFDIALSGLWIFALDNEGFTTLFTGPDSYTERDGGTSGVIPGNSNRVYVCSHDAVDESYTMTFYHPLHPDAPTL